MKPGEWVTSDELRHTIKMGFDLLDIFCELFWVFVIYFLWNVWKAVKPYLKSKERG